MMLYKLIKKMKNSRKIIYNPAIPKLLDFYQVRKVNEIIVNFNHILFYCLFYLPRKYLLSLTNKIMTFLFYIKI